LEEVSAALAKIKEAATGAIRMEQSDLGRSEELAADEQGDEVPR
jgi:hypothetical protein